MTPAFRLPTKKADPRCSCVNGQYECGWCSAIKRQRIWRQMTLQQQTYDRYVDPHNSAVLDSERHLDLDRIGRGCSCHISPPCSWCTDPENPRNQEDA
jgi:hypothetical protein